jgi:hypothetical protein
MSDGYGTSENGHLHTLRPLITFSMDVLVVFTIAVLLIYLRQSIILHSLQMLTRQRRDWGVTLRKSLNQHI